MGNILNVEGTPEQLATILGQLSTGKRYRLVEVLDHPVSAEQKRSLVDPEAAASIELLNSWIEQGPTDPEGIRAAEEELREFKHNMNLPRKEAGARLLYPDEE